MTRYCALALLCVLAASAVNGQSATCSCPGTPASTALCTVWTGTVCTTAYLDAFFGANTVTSATGACSSGVAGSATCTASFSGSCPNANTAANDCAAVCAAVEAAVSATGVWSCGSSSSSCFPAHATVQLNNGSSVRMDQLNVGDKVLVNEKKEFSDVFMFSHRLAEATTEFVHIRSVQGHSLMLTPNHYLYVNGKLAIASTVTAGDHVTTKDGAKVAVASVARTQAEGIYNPNTMNGDIVVDGIVTSTYTSDINPSLAHAALWPVRMAYSLGADVVGHAFDSGSDLIASVMPDGKARY